ncbi:MAG: transposase [Candidatus Omnitrophota bacterium]|nr:transposase [Candidatus Omnitrophota bacterium]
MKITQTAQKIKVNFAMDIAVDVHKDTLNFFFETEGKEYADECQNRTSVLEKKLKAYHEIALEHGIKTLRIICEPTGEYQNKLFRTARRMGFLTCFVNAESVTKFRVVETNDNGKTDTKDPRVIRTLGQLNKTIRHRILDEDYLTLRKLNKVLDEVDEVKKGIRCRISKLLVELFCDCSFEKDFLYIPSGRALVDKFGCNPYRIVNTGYTRFSKIMKKAAPRIREMTLKRLWDDAQSSILNEQSEEYIEVIEIQLKQLMEDYWRHEARSEAIIERMIEILNGLRKKDPNIPQATEGVINDKHIARLLGETGPLGDFTSWRMLMRYAGLNIRMRQSGKYSGQNKITKKGRPLLRKVLQQIVFPLVRQNWIYGPYYHRKKEIDKMPGNKAMTCVARHFLKKFYGWYKSGAAFSQQRFFACETQYRKAA